MDDTKALRGGIVEIKVCVGSSCHLRGSRAVAEALQKLIGTRNAVKLTGAFCMGDCRGGVCVQINGEKFSLLPGEEAAFFEKEVLTRLHRQEM